MPFSLPKVFSPFLFVVALAIPCVAQESIPSEAESEWCQNCKAAEREGCRASCKDEQGVKYFVCLDKCTNRRCEMQCTPVEDEPEAKQEKTEKQKKKLCRTCRRQANRECKANCSDQANGRKRAVCKKKCVAQACADSCTQ